jgi:hypothetical protein
MKHPENISGDPKGYNTQLFPNHRAVRRALRRLGYHLSLANIKVPRPIARHFQKDFDFCSVKRHRNWGVVKIDGMMDKPDLNALEIALNFALKQSAARNVPAGVFWQRNCSMMRPKKRPPHRGPVGKGKAFIEMWSRHAGTLKRPGKEDVRVQILRLAKKGKRLLAQAKIPLQAGHEGDLTPRWYLAIWRPMMTGAQ